MRNLLFLLLLIAVVLVPVVVVAAAAADMHAMHDSYTIWKITPHHGIVAVKTSRPEESWNKAMVLEGSGKDILEPWIVTRFWDTV